MSTALMAPRKKNKRSNTSMAIAKAIIDEYQPKTAEEMQDALKDIFGPMFEAMLQGEIPIWAMRRITTAIRIQRTDVMATSTRM